MTFFIDRLTQNEADIIKMTFGNYNNRKYYNSEICVHFEMAPDKVRRTKDNGIQKLMSRSNVIQENAIIHNTISTVTVLETNRIYTDKEKSRMLEIYDEIFNSNLIFIPDKEFSQEPNSITTTQIEKLASELSWIKKRASLRQQYQNQGKTSVKDESCILIEELDVSFETYYRLKKAKIGNVFQLRKMTREDLMLIANMQTEIVEEIEIALNKLYPERSQTYLEKVRASKALLEREVARLKVELQNAEELLATYEALLSGNTLSNEAVPDLQGE